ncbi:hypothetical protein HDV05_007479 [Chytridiales sp. JEL 0842]|nr:hypothetical protein HDV05_007479 [Chytridiales sp. JEL 0842]
MFNQQKSLALITLIALTLFALFGFTSAAPTAMSARDDTPAPPTEFTAEQISAFAADFAVLRTIKGHFEGGEWNDDVDKYNGKKHLALIALGQYFGKPSTPLQTLAETMGSPDEVVPYTEPTADQMPGPILSANPSASLLNTETVGDIYVIYYWRGRRDFLWFLVDGEQKVVKSDWYLSYE